MSDKIDELIKSVATLVADVKHVREKTDAIDNKVQVLNDKAIVIEMTVQTVHKRMDQVEPVVYGVEKRLTALEPIVHQIHPLVTKHETMVVESRGASRVVNFLIGACGAAAGGFVTWLLK